MRLIILLAVLTASAAVAGEPTKLTSLPDTEGFAGSFAGVSHDKLIVAGGANFPDKKPWEGGKKKWYDTIYVLDQPDGKWKIAGKLPRPLGYGVCVTHRETVICVGGSDSDRHYADAFRIEWKDGNIRLTELPPLPKTVANACGALVGDILYVAGGQEKPDSREALKNVWQLDLSATRPLWREVTAFPGPGRILAVAVSFGGKFWLISGAELMAGKGDQIERRYLKDAYSYDAGSGWKRIMDVPRPVVAAPSPAPADATGFLILGGDDGGQVGIPPERHRGFTGSILRFDANKNLWRDGVELRVAPVTTPCVSWREGWVIPTGEIRPGVRTPEVRSFKE